MIIDVTGFGWSGSGAVHDLLREYSDVHFASYDYDWEFTLLWTCDGIYDLEHKLCHKHCRMGDSSMAIRRFLSLVEAQSRTAFMHYDKIFRGNYYQICQDYINDLIQFSFEGSTFQDTMYPDKKEFFRKRYNKVVKKLLGNHLIINHFHKDFSKPYILQQKHVIAVSYNPENFLSRTQQLLSTLLSYVRPNDEIPLVTDQMFPPDMPTAFFKYINEPLRCIVVRRDPRDTYLLAKSTYQSTIPIPVSNVKDFIIFYKKTIEETKLPDSENLLNVQFEDLIFHYENTVQMIERFLGITQHHDAKRKFNPAISVNNTQLYKRYNGFEDDIKRIEEALPESLYPFESMPKIEAIKGVTF